jgi:hypothetical protein
LTTDVEVPLRPLSVGLPEVVRQDDKIWELDFTVEVGIPVELVARN